MKKRIEEIIVVEGRDDISAVKSAVDAEVIQVNGYAVKKKSTIEKIGVAQKNRGIIVLTDPDYAGEMIRRYIHKFFPDSKDAYISRAEGTKDGDIGVENATPDAIIKALDRARATVVEKNNEEFSIEDLYENGLVGRDNSKVIREKLGTKLGIGYSNAKQLLSKLNRYGITREEFEKAMENIEK